MKWTNMILFKILLIYCIGSNLEQEIILVDEYATESVTFKKKNNSDF